MTVLISAGLLAVAVVFFVLHPVLFGEAAPMGRDDEELTDAQHRKKISLLALRDVEYDFHAGKLDEADYRRMKEEIASEALQAIDVEEAEWAARAASKGGATASAPEGTGLIGEEAFTRGGAVPVTDSIEAEIAALRASIREGIVCPHCGHPNARGSRFCGDCGSALPRAEGSAGAKAASGGKSRKGGL
jgi:cytochrome c-type biogenesis protein CcmI